MKMLYYIQEVETVFTSLEEARACAISLTEADIAKMEGYMTKYSYGSAWKSLVEREKDQLKKFQAREDESFTGHVFLNPVIILKSAMAQVSQCHCGYIVSWWQAHSLQLCADDVTDYIIEVAKREKKNATGEEAIKISWALEDFKETGNWEDLDYIASVSKVKII